MYFNFWSSVVSFKESSLESGALEEFSPWIYLRCWSSLSCFIFLICIKSWSLSLLFLDLISRRARSLVSHFLISLFRPFANFWPIESMYFCLSYWAMFCCISMFLFHSSSSSYDRSFCGPSCQSRSSSSISWSAFSFCLASSSSFCFWSLCFSICSYFILYCCIIIIFLFSISILRFFSSSIWSCWCCFSFSYSDWACSYSEILWRSSSSFSAWTRFYSSWILICSCSFLICS